MQIMKRYTINDSKKKKGDIRDRKRKTKRVPRYPESLSSTSPFVLVYKKKQIGGVGTDLSSGETLK